MSLPPVSQGDPHTPAHNAERDAINALEEALKTKIGLPSGASTGDLLRWDGTQWLTTETRFFEGEGRPDGQIAAPIGSRYVDKLGAQGAVEWVKRAGTPDSAVGWICLAGDTGDRNISASVLKRTGTVVNSGHLQRSGQIVHFYVDITMPTNVSSPYKIFDLPLGFRPIHDIYGGLTDNKEGADTGGTLVMATGVVNIYTPVAGKRDRYHGIWPTQDAWPSALPGTGTIT